jgi:hypothetical protein
MFLPNLHNTTINQFPSLDEIGGEFFRATQLVKEVTGK